MAAQPGGAGQAGQGAGQIRVMVVDDSAVIRGLLSRSLEADPDVRVVATCADGQVAVRTAGRQEMDVIVLDIEMPVMDGLTALPELLKARPGVKVLIASTLTLRGADISMRAIQAGASEYLPKPQSTRDVNAAEAFKKELLEKVKALGSAAAKKRGGEAPAPAGKGGEGGGFTAGKQKSGAAAGGPAPAAPTPPKPQARGGGGAAPAEAAPAAPAKGKGEISLRQASQRRPEIIAIGSSTGGPQALFEVVAQIGGDIQQPIVITQHMPATFTTILADHISRMCKVTCHEASNGMELAPNTVYLAPGDYHMTLSPRGGQTSIKLTKDPPENYCRPAVDPMLRSVATIYGARALACILTGMGHDGLKGSDKLVEAGGTVVAQDEASSVVWGMPGAVANAGLCAAVLPLKEIGSYIRKLALRTAA